MNVAKSIARFVPRRLRSCGRDWIETQVRGTPPAMLGHRSSELFANLDMVLAHYRLEHSKIRYLQVGAFDGVSGDPIYPLIERHRLQGILVEPQKDVFERLKSNYVRFPHFQFVNAAIDDHDGCSTLFRIKLSADRPEWVGQIASFDRSVLMRHAYLVPNLETMIEAEQVRCTTFETLFNESGIKEVDLLQIDAEGFDAEILRLFNVPARKPAIVHFEHKHLSIGDHRGAIGMLVGQGYRLSVSESDTLAYRVAANL